MKRLPTRMPTKMKMKMKTKDIIRQTAFVTIIFTILIGAVIVINSLFNASWFIGHDNGEAYEAYTESMREYGMEE